jgi:hypothetical protein
MVPDVPQICYARLVWREFFLFLAQIWNIFWIWPVFENIFKTSPFGPAIMHGGANELYPAIHSGRVPLPRGL